MILAIVFQPRNIETNQIHVLAETMGLRVQRPLWRQMSNLRKLQTVHPPEQVKKNNFQLSETKDHST
jgi:hypothetical protein